jgi:hypothetical protein
MRYVFFAICVLTLGCASTAGFFKIKTVRAMEDILDWGKFKPGMFEEMFRDVAVEYKLLEPDGELTRKYNRYLKLNVWLMIVFILEVILFYH